MIKKNAQGKVVEFEDEAAVAAMNAPRGSKKAKPVEPAGEVVMNDKQALAEYEAAIKTMEEAASDTFKTFSLGLAEEVVQLDKLNQKERATAKTMFKGALRELELAYKAKAELIHQTYQATLGALRGTYQLGMAEINAKLEAGKAQIEIAKQRDLDAALTAYEARLSAISQEEAAESKLEAVSAESLPATTP
jgi:hypothetical protein